MKYRTSENATVEPYLQIASNHIIAYHNVISQLSTKTRDELDDIVKDAEREFMIYLIHPAGTSEISDLCGNVSNFGFNVSQWAEVDIASFPKKRNENPEISA